MISLYSARWGLSRCFSASQRRERLEMPASLCASVCVCDGALHDNGSRMTVHALLRRTQKNCTTASVLKQTGNVLMLVMHQTACGGSTGTAGSVSLLLLLNSLLLPSCVGLFNILSPSFSSRILCFPSSSFHYLFLGGSALCEQSKHGWPGRPKAPGTSPGLLCNNVLSFHSNPL